MLFSKFSHYLQELESISARLEITAKLAELYKELDDKEVKPASYLLLGVLKPPYESLEFQLSTKMILRALARVLVNSENNVDSGVTDLFGQSDTSATEAKVETLFKKLGDLGLVAEQVIGDKSVGKSTLQILPVYEALSQIAQVSGAGSQEQKLMGLIELLEKLDATAAKFVIRIIMGNLRLGFSTMTMLDALSWTVKGDKSDSAQLEEAFQKKADIGELAAAYVSGQDLSKYTVQVGVPVLPALCQRLNTAQEIIDKMTEVIVEPKYDGVRVQIHIDKNAPSEHQVKTYTRSLEENSYQFPELQTVLHELNCTSCILDAEAIGYDKATGRLLPFQETITRKRKHEVEERAASVPLKFFVFDILSLNEKPLLSEKLRDRKDLLKKLFKENEVLSHTPYIETTQPEEVRAFHTHQLAEGLEGAVIKQIDSQYQSGRKGWSWVKIKEEEGTRGKLNDTLDCVVMGYYVGKGKRTQFGLGAFLVGVLDAENDGVIKTIAKIGTGLSDDQFRDMKQRCQPFEVTEMPKQYLVNKGLAPDMWVAPGIVVEIAADEITTSPIHTAGVALRFPRLVKFRDDKKWTAATTTKELTSF